MEIVIDNWFMVIAFACVIIFTTLEIRDFFNSPSDEQVKMVKEWLLYAVTMAEREFGNGTGKLKLRYVYDLFIVKFPFLVKIVPFDIFASWVDDALEKMKKLLESNENIKIFIEGEN